MEWEPFLYLWKNSIGERKRGRDITIAAFSGESKQSENHACQYVLKKSPISPIVSFSMLMRGRYTTRK